MQNLAAWMQVKIWDNTLEGYLSALFVFILAMLLLRLLKHSVLSRFKKAVQKTSGKINTMAIAMIDETLIPLLYVAAFYFAANQLTLNPVVDKLVQAVGVIALTIQMVRLTLVFLRSFLEEKWFLKNNPSGSNPISRSILTVIEGAVWGAGIILILDNLGFNVSAVVAGLGIGGVAVALAAQTILGDLFNYFVIFFDKPFEEGDSIVFEDYTGVVEHIGIKSTRIRAADGEQIVVANSGLTASKIRNYKRMAQRRIVFQVGVVYQTPNEKLSKIPEMIRDIVRPLEKARFDRAHFSKFTDFSLNFEVVYFVLSSDYNHYMDIQQKINLAVKAAFEKEGIEFAYPTQLQYQKELKG